MQMEPASEPLLNIYLKNSEHTLRVIIGSALSNDEGGGGRI